MTGSATEACSWCGAAVEPGGGFRAYQPAGERRAVFCRLEHIVPWELRGAPWEAGSAAGPETLAAPADEGESERPCSHCAEPLDQDAVLLVRHRDGHRIGDGFCSANHMAAWAKAGGRWQ